LYTQSKQRFSAPMDSTIEIPSAMATLRSASSAFWNPVWQNHRATLPFLSPDVAL